MKKVLVTGAAGMIGYRVLEHLIKESKYEITALDLKNSKSEKKFRKLNTKVNIIYGDINNEVLISSLIKDHDFVIHLAAILPPLADFKPELTTIVNYEGTKNIVDAINKHNPNCFLLFSSSISVYGDRLKNPYIKVGDPVGINPYDYYASCKVKTENYIIKNLKNYTIFRLTAIMGRPATDPLMFHMPLDTKLEISSDVDTALAFVKALNHTEEVKGKVFNLGGGKRCRTTYREFLAKMFTIYGLNFNFLEAYAFAEKNFHCGYYEDSDDLEKILHYRRDTLATYLTRVERETNSWKRFFAKLLSKPVVYALNRKSEPLKARKENNKNLIKRYFNR